MYNPKPVPTIPAEDETYVPEPLSYREAVLGLPDRPGVRR